MMNDEEDNLLHGYLYGDRITCFCLLDRNKATNDQHVKSLKILFVLAQSIICSNFQVVDRGTWFFVH